MKYSCLLLDSTTSGEPQNEDLMLDVQYRSFYMGDKEENRKASPYFFELKDGSRFAQWYFQNGWGQSWGVPVYSSATFEEVYRHFRKFLMIKTEDGERLYFRFYDPRVLRSFLPTCDAVQLETFFGPVDSFFCEDEDPEYVLVFTRHQGQLHVERMESSVIIQKEQ